WVVRLNLETADRRSVLGDGLGYVYDRVALGLRVRHQEAASAVPLRVGRERVATRVGGREPLPEDLVGEPEASGRVREGGSHPSEARRHRRNRRYRFTGPIERDADHRDVPGLSAGRDREDDRTRALVPYVGWGGTKLCRHRSHPLPC